MVQLFVRLFVAEAFLAWTKNSHLLLTYFLKIFATIKTQMALLCDNILNRRVEEKICDRVNPFGAETMVYHKKQFKMKLISRRSSFRTLGPVSISDKTSYRKFAWSLEAARLKVDGYLGSIAVVVHVKFQSGRKILNTKGPFQERVFIVIQIWWKIIFVVTLSWVIISLQNLAHATTAQLCHVRNFIAVTSLQLWREQN